MFIMVLCFSSYSSMVLVVRFRSAGTEDFCGYQLLFELLFELHHSRLAVCCFDKGARTGYPLSGRWLDINLRHV